MRGLTLPLSSRPAEEGVAQEGLVRRDQGVPGGGIELGEVVQGESRHCGSLPGCVQEKRFVL